MHLFGVRKRWYEYTIEFKEKRSLPDCLFLNKTILDAEQLKVSVCLMCFEKFRLLQKNKTNCVNNHIVLCS